MEELYVVLIKSGSLFYENKIFCPDLTTVREYLLELVESGSNVDNTTKFQVQLWTQNTDYTYSYNGTVLKGNLFTFNALAIK